MELKTATLGNGCFWCTEAFFQRLKGVVRVCSGFSGGFVKNPAYREVITGNTGHAEVLQVYYDPCKISFEKLVTVFFATHDPTTLNRQGNDIGTQYRSVVFYRDELEKSTVEKMISDLEMSHVYKNKIVTQLEEFKAFYPAESYHQNYYNTHKEAPYCKLVIAPKLHVFINQFRSNIDV